MSGVGEAMAVAASTKSLSVGGLQETCSVGLARGGLLVGGCG